MRAHHYFAMMSANDSHVPYPCLGRRCGHEATDHVLTPELAGPTEVVVWCAKCHRHETRRPTRWSGLFGRTEARRLRTRIGRAS